MVAFDIMEFLGLDGLFVILIAGQMATVYLVFQIWLSNRAEHAKLVSRLDQQHNNLMKHEKTCAEHWGIVSTKLEQLKIGS